MRNQSKKMGKITRSYSKMRKEFLLNKPMCHARIYKCSLRATDIHHMRGRGKYHLDTETWLPVCRNCHMWIEENSEDSKELGFSDSRIE